MRARTGSCPANFTTQIPSPHRHLLALHPSARVRSALFRSSCLMHMHVQLVNSSVRKKARVSSETCPPLVKFVQLLSWVGVSSTFSIRMLLLYLFTFSIAWLDFLFCSSLSFLISRLSPEMHLNPCSVSQLISDN